LLEHEPRAFKKEGDKMVVDVENLKTKEMKTLTTDGIFVFIGQKPNLDVFGNQLELDQWGYIKTDEDKRSNIDGVFAVGDVTSKKYRQITTAIADGTIAAIAITREIG
jgi:thioredoxin reductase (NADPH)